MRHETIRFDKDTVPYRYGADCAPEIADAIARECPDADAVVLVVDERARGHAAEIEEQLARHLPVLPFRIGADERDKRLPLVESLLEFAVARRATRRTVLAAMGGGLVGNVTGLAAALLFRGTRLVHLPTTPVAAFDAVLSLKQAVNLSGGKNLAGAYHLPTLIAVDLRWLTTIPRRELLTGLAEMAKNVLAVVPGMEDAFLSAVADLSARPVEAFTGLCEIGLRAKMPYLERDPRERRSALVFEYGHTVGHALEFLSGGEIGHGEAVACGMLVAARIGADRGLLGPGDLARHHRVVSALGLDPSRPARVLPAPAAVRAVVERDNKRGYVPCAPDEVPMVLLAGAGGPVTGVDGIPLVPVPVDEVLAAAADVVWAGRWNPACSTA